MKQKLAALITLLVITCSIATGKENAGECKTNKTAPPLGSYAWTADAEVRVYFFRNMFTSEEREAL